MPGDQFVEVEAMTPKDEAQPQKAEAPKPADESKHLPKAGLVESHGSAE